MKEIYVIKGERKESFLDNYSPFQEEVSKATLIELLQNPKVIVYEAQRKTTEK